MILATTTEELAAYITSSAYSNWSAHLITADMLSFDSVVTDGMVQA